VEFWEDRLAPDGERMRMLCYCEDCPAWQTADGHSWPPIAVGPSPPGMAGVATAVLPTAQCEYHMKYSVKQPLCVTLAVATLQD
jgi:hypothetical protein